MTKNAIGGAWLRVAAASLLVALVATGAAAQNTGSAKSPEQAREQLAALMTALQKLHPDNKELARRTVRLTDRLNSLTEEQLTALAASLSSTDLSSSVKRLSEAQPLAGASALVQVQLASVLPGAQYDSCGSIRSDTDSGRDLVIASDALNIAAIAGDVVCNSIFVVIGEGSNIPGCIAAGVLHEAVQAVDFERDLRGYCDAVIDSNEIRGILDNTGVLHSDLATHDTDIKLALGAHDADIKAALAKHDAEIKAILAIVNQKLDAQAVFLVNFRELTMRTQIEADLASGEASTPVGLYVNADAICATGFCQGYINQVRALVVQAIASLAGSATGQANVRLDKGDAFLNARNLKSAYGEYRAAYKLAVGMGGK